LKSIEAVSHIGYGQRQHSVRLEQRFAIVEKPEQVRDVFDDVGSDDVVVAAGTVDDFGDGAAASDVVDFFDIRGVDSGIATEMLAQFIRVAVIGNLNLITCAFWHDGCV
jgi:hypothetical protein